jgi:hypothetical protein
VFQCSLDARATGVVRVQSEGEFVNSGVSEECDVLGAKIGTPQGGHVWEAASLKMDDVHDPFHENEVVSTFGMTKGHVKAEKTVLGSSIQVEILGSALGRDVASPEGLDLSETVSPGP